MKIEVSKKPILILSYKNCEIYCCHLDGFKSNTDKLLYRLQQIETEILGKSNNRKFRIWFNIDENNLNKATIQLILESINRINKHIIKIAFIGLRGITKIRFKHIVEKHLKTSDVSIGYFTNAELAKAWLV